MSMIAWLHHALARQRRMVARRSLRVEFLEYRTMLSADPTTVEWESLGESGAIDNGGAAEALCTELPSSDDSAAGMQSEAEAVDAPFVFVDQSASDPAAVDVLVGAADDAASYQVDEFGSDWGIVESEMPHDETPTAVAFPSAEDTGLPDAGATIEAALADVVTGDEASGSGIPAESEAGGTVAGDAALVPAIVPEGDPAAAGDSLTPADDAFCRTVAGDCLPSDSPVEQALDNAGGDDAYPAWDGPTDAAGDAVPQAEQGTADEPVAETGTENPVSDGGEQTPVVEDPASPSDPSPAGDAPEPEATVPITEVPPVIVSFTASAGMSEVWVFEGRVEYSEPWVLMVNFGGLLQGESVSVQADGTFCYSTVLPAGANGTVTAQTNGSNVAVEWIS